MADNPKERGKHNRISKHKNKTKNQPPKSKPNPVKLESNWDRYQADEELPKIGASGASTDFAILASAPITRGSHFQFKSDKTVIEENTTCDLFNLDLKLLSRSLMSIPFFMRNGIDKNLFTSAQKHVMENISQQDQHVRYLQDNENGTSFFCEEEESSGTDSETEINATINDAGQTLEPPKNNENDLEQWLDDILDD